MFSTTLSAGLSAGVARRDITPLLEARMSLWGYSDGGSPAQAVLDPLYARVLVLKGGSGSFALVTLDLGRTFSPSLLDPLRLQLQKAAGLDDIFFAASHTHAGPDVQGSALTGPAADWARSALDGVRAAVVEAASSAEPVRFGFGTGSSDIANNRRIIRPEGAVQMIWRDSPKIRNHPIDPSVRVLRLDRADGRPLAVLVHYSCHPVTLAAENRKYSADWPGAMMRTIEEEVPGHPLAIFLQGAPGDINLMESLAGKNGEQELMQIGRSIGEEAARVARSIETAAGDALPIRTHVLEFTFANRWDFHRLMSRAQPPLFKIFADGFQPEMKIRVNVVAVGSIWALATMPGEPFISFQTHLAEQSPIANIWLLGYSDGYFGYFPTIRAAADGGYGANGIEAWVEVGAGERIVNEVMAALYRFTGKLAEMPAQLE